MRALLGFFVEKVAFFHAGTLLDWPPSGSVRQSWPYCCNEKYCIIGAAAQRGILREVYG
jgi:hypothetical protein